MSIRKANKLKYHKVKKQRNDSDEEDEEYLENFLFGEKKENVFKDIAQKVDSDSESNASDNDLLPFSISTNPNTDDTDDKIEELFPIKVNKKKGLKPAWVDEDDKQVSIDLNGKSQFKHFRNETEVSGLKFQERLKTHFEKVTPAPAWAVFKESEPSEDESEEEEKSILRSTTKVLEKSEKLSKGLLRIMRVKNLNITQPTNATITGLEFHPTAKIAFTTSLNRRLNIFQVDGKENPTLQSIYVSNFPIYKSHFACGGNKIVLSSRRMFYYVYDMLAGKIIKIPYLKGRKEKSLESFHISPNGEIIAFHGDSGYVNFVSAMSNQYMYSLKMNSNIVSSAFSADSTKLFTTGRFGEVYIWDLKSRKCEHKFVDDGSVRSTSITVSNDDKYIAVGSNSGVVNIYDSLPCLTQSNPKPVKGMMNLKTTIGEAKFNSTSEILATSSPCVRNAIKMVHIPSFTTFSNWPLKQQTLGNVSCLDFSPMSGYIGIGNEAGKALLFRLKHFPDS